MHRRLRSLDRDHVDARCPSPTEEAMRREREELVRKFLRALDPRTRQIMEFFYSDRAGKLPVADFANGLGMSRQNCSRVHAKGRDQARSCPWLRAVSDHVAS